MLTHVKSVAAILGSAVSDCVPRRRPLGKTRGAPGENPRVTGRAICCELRGALSAKYSAVGTRHDGGEQPLSEQTTAVARHDNEKHDGDDVDDGNSSNKEEDDGDNEYDDDVSARRRFNTRRRKTHRCKKEVMVAKEQEAA